ncbi:MAG TPA: DEAD/DEAH box helicase [Pseudobacteroides sp.]|uniref:DEAD/DEAH box helicase n=1 Tax=Pseudobacteroides sp. TaxID=1968840 RepID=UPI002F951F9D
MDKNIIDFRKTSFGKGLNAAYGKIPIKLECCFSPCEETGFFKLSLYIGMDKVYKINNVGQFLEALSAFRPYHFGKSFIFEPDKMAFDMVGKDIMDFLSTLWTRRKHLGNGIDREKEELHTGDLVFYEYEMESLLDFLWDKRESIVYHRNSQKIYFSDKFGIKISIDKESDFAVMSLDYSDIGDFEPVTVNYRYIFSKVTGMVARPQKSSREVLKSIYGYKNNECVVSLKISNEDRKIFKKNFYDKYRNDLDISIDKEFLEDLNKNSLVSKAYFDIAAKGIVSKIEHCYGEKVINPLNEIGKDKSIREPDAEREVENALKGYGFKEQGKLYILDDVERIILLLTDNLQSLKKICQVYYSEDFKKLHVRNVSIFGLSLSGDESIIHMNINLENISDDELIGLLESIKNGKKYYRLKNGSIINLASVESSKFAELIKGLGIDKGNIKDGIIEMPSNKCLYIDNYLKKNGMEDVEMDSTLRSYINNLSKHMDSEILFNDRLKGVLRDYQATGVQWLRAMASYSFGGILADDMGLGKTLQVLAFMSAEKNRDLPSIVVAPTSVVYNWKIEAEKFTPDLKVTVINGTKERRTLQIMALKDYDLGVTSYGALKNDIEDYKKIKFQYVFLDEAQNIKNPLTLNAGSVKELNANCRFAMTGTPIENRLSEIWSIFDFIMPGYLLSRSEFTSIYEEPITYGNDKKKEEELSNLVKPFILRRLKKDVLKELPEKLESQYFSEMAKEQKKLYVAYYKQVKNELKSKIQDTGIENNRLEILAALTRLRQICAHPGTFLDDYKGGSGKLDQALELIAESIGSGHSVLLFSQFTKLLKILRNELIKNNINHYYLDGTMTPHERVMEIDNFNSDIEAVFLISLKAGGTGINLTKADIVIHFDPWWNPAVENQASDRAHRMGQKNVVNVYKLLTAGTIEEKIARLQDRKKDLIESIIKPGETFISNLSSDDLRDLFDI